MEIYQQLIKNNQSFDFKSNEKAQLVLCFGNKTMLKNKETITKIMQRFPNAFNLFCSTAGEILGDNVYDNSISLTAITFSKTVVKATCNNIADCTDSYDAGKNIASKIDQNGLRYVLLISDGSIVNGSELIRGINEVIDNKIPITGGLAGDGTAFESTLTGVNISPESGRIIAVSFYGDHLKISHGSMGGWEPFGLERIVTKSEGNVLYEIDGKSALDLYKNYLGKYADDLPGSALLFPLSVKINGGGDTVVRTILSVNHDNKTMSFAGDIETGAKVRFMKANFDKLVDAASLAANQSLTEFKDIQPDLAILISCVGRKAILSERIDEEVEAVKDALPDKTYLAGFYSYGEISPLKPNTSCELHNQTMTVTCLQEVE